jgi:RNA polymerase sigma-70 factor, ECF subfamily
LLRDTGDESMPERPSAPPGGSTLGVHEAIARAREGDPDAIHYLYAVYADDLCAFVRSIVRDHHDAEDVTQSVFARLPAILDRYQERDAAFAAWLFRVARNAALDHMRGRRPIPVEEVRAAELSDPLGDRERSRALRGALDQLPDDQRQVVLLRHVLGMSPGEIADLTGRSEGSVHGLHHRGRQAVQANLRRSGTSPVTPRRLAG